MIAKNTNFSHRLKELLEIYNRSKTKNRSDSWLMDLLSFLKNKDADLFEYALKSKDITEKYFGKSILLYAPLYISDYCVNGCLYCGFSALNKIKRKKLSLKEIELEMIELKNKNFDTILILSGEDRKNSPFIYIKDAVKLASKYFSEVLIEVYPLQIHEYRTLVKNGLVGVTLYQETYDVKLYDKLHKFGPKKDFYFRLTSLERALEAGVKEVNLGVLLGLKKDWIFDVFLCIAHAHFLQEKYPNAEINISFPRIKESVAKNKCYAVSDKEFVKIIISARIFLPRVGINISTRESSTIRDNLIGLGVTRMSAESKTTVGGYYLKENTNHQFEVSDNRGVEEIVQIISRKGYRAEFTNWIKSIT